MLLSYQRALLDEQMRLWQACLAKGTDAKTDWATDSSEMKQSGIERVRRTKDSADEIIDTLERIRTRKFFSLSSSFAQNSACSH